MDGIAGGKIIIPNYNPDYNNFSDNAKDEVVKGDYDFNFQSSISTIITTTSRNHP